MNYTRNIYAVLLIGAISISNVFCTEQSNQPGRIERLKNFASSAAASTYNKSKALFTAENVLMASLVAGGLCLGYQYYENNIMQQQLLSTMKVLCQDLETISKNVDGLSQRINNVQEGVQTTLVKEIAALAESSAQNNDALKKMYQNTQTLLRDNFLTTGGLFAGNAEKLENLATQFAALVADNKQISGNIAVLIEKSSAQG